MVQHGLRFPRKFRLCGRNAFVPILAAVPVHARTVQVYARPNGLLFSRLGIVVSKRVDHRAVARNRIKRLVREQFRQQQYAWAGFDIVVKVKPRVDLARLAVELSDTIQRAMGRWHQHSVNKQR